ncbi:MAG: IS630 family transposase [Hormoscilla sp. GUM202]|nr:IS630 family transposase [Hormoscilla sp. GUM202]
MERQRYIVRLSPEERQELENLVKKGKSSAFKIRHAQILLHSDANRECLSVEAIATMLHCNKNTVVEVRKRLVEKGFAAALERKKRSAPPTPRLFDGEAEARLIALACSTPPEGRVRWTLQLLADRVVELNIVPHCTANTIHEVLKKTCLLPHLREYWVIPPEENADFVAAMEDVLDIYQRPYDANVPVVCMDEQPVQLTKETRIPLPPEPGKPARYDYEYERNGTASIFMFCEPLSGKRTVEANEHRTMTDWAQQIKHLLDVDYPTAQKVILVCDNLNTHKPAALYKTFPPQEAKRLLNRLEIHHTPKHGSWLNMAEIELAALTRQCLDRRIEDLPTLQSELAAWKRARNATGKTISWQFTTADARIKLERLYPFFND